MSAILTLDDTDPSIVYSLGWGRAGSKLEYNSTTSFTRVAGTSARVTFQGTSIGVYGTVAARDRLLLPPVTSYIIDGGAPVTFTATPAARAEYSQLFFQSPVLPSGQHTLVITHALASASFFLDFMQVTMDTVPTIPSSSAISSATSASSTSVLSSTTSLISSTTSSLSSTTVLSTPSPTPIFTSSSSTIFSTTSSIDAKSSDSAKDENVGSTSASKSSNAGAIAGGIIGAIIALALIVFGVIFYRRKQERRRRNEYLDYKSDGHVWTPGASAAAAASSSASIEPFSNAQSSPAAPPVRSQQTMSQASLPQTQSYGYAQPRYPGGYAPPPTTAGNPNMYNNPAYASPAPAQSAYTFAPSEEEDPYGGYETRNAYGQGQTQGYPTGAYLSPSQLMNAYNNDYGRGMPNRPY